MIIDNIKNSGFYSRLDAKIQKALDYLTRTDFSGMASGRYDIDGNNVFALVQRYETKPREQGVWEAHRRYIDLQYVAAGTEIMGYAPLDHLTVTKPYVPENDCELLSGTGDFFTVAAGNFAIFYPQDAHMPCLTGGIPQPVVKVVVKIAVA